ncbi:hypothetical protein EBN15_19135 [Xanthomonas cucurbitae]|nr:hypothetical protein EBN15_19135 [Xanthomonas cucurbitae]
MLPVAMSVPCAGQPNPCKYRLFRQLFQLAPWTWPRNDQPVTLCPGVTHICKPPQESAAESGAMIHQLLSPEFMSRSNA